jgi:hypothetical protein
MTIRAIVFGFALSTFDVARGLFPAEQRKAVIHVLDELGCPPCFYLRIEDQVFAVALRD